jgi:hypothetical protein
MAMRSASMPQRCGVRADVGEGVGHVGEGGFGAAHQFIDGGGRQAEQAAHEVDAASLHTLPDALDRPRQRRGLLLRQPVADREAHVAAQGEAFAIHVHRRVVRAALLELVAVLRAAVEGAAVRQHQRRATARRRVAGWQVNVHQQRAVAGPGAAVADGPFAMAKVALDPDGRLRVGSDAAHGLHMLVVGRGRKGPKGAGAGDGRRRGRPRAVSWA